MRCEAVIYRGVLHRCGAVACSQIEAVRHAPYAVCYACREGQLSALMRAGYQARIVPVTDGERSKSR